MEKLIINIPDNKSRLVKQLLKELGVIIYPEKKAITSSYKQKLVKISTWSEQDLNVLEESKKAFDQMKAQEW